MLHWTSTNKAAALALLLSSAQAHLIMKSPVPYGKDVIDNSPLTPQNFPCKYTGDKSFYSGATKNKMVIGEPQTLSFEGSATHDGGSCQLALTKDLAPTASTSWAVILSIEGGCPTKGGTAPSEYEFTIPDSIAPGDYSFAWSWISKLSGVQEYYQNCALISVETGSGSTKRSDGNELGNELGNYTYYNETMMVPRAEGLPEMFVGNLAGINSCKTTLSTDPKYPDPGPNVQHFGKPSYGKVTGSNCVGKGLKEGVSNGAGSVSGGGSTGGGDGGDSGSGGNGGSDGGDDSCSEDPTPSATPTPSGSPSSGSPTPSSEPSSAPPDPSSGGPSSTPVASPSSSPTPPSGGGGSGSGGSGAGKTGTCTTEGTFNCDGSSYQQCAAGSWTSMQSLPPGTSCVKGESTSLWARDIKRRARNSRRADF